MTQLAPAKKTRSTTQKAHIRAALKAEQKFVTAQQLHERLRAEGAAVGIATVYRQLGTLAAEGAIDSIQTENGTLFRSCDSSGHHHHMVCESCGAAYDLDIPQESWFSEQAQALGFHISRHVIEVFGICQSCAQDAQAQS